MIRTPMFDHHDLVLMGDIHMAQDLKMETDEVVVPESELSNYNMECWEIVEEIV